MNIERKARQLNRKHFALFGFNPFGGLNYQWMRATELHFLIEPTETSMVQTPAGLWVPGELQYERHSWGEMRGADGKPLGNSWVMAHWVAPISEAAWKTKYQNKAPWPKHGEYAPIENWVCRRDEDLENESAHAEFALRQHLSKTYDDFLEDATAAAQKVKRDEREEFGDFVDDAMTAFGNIPGSRSTGVSLPSKETSVAS